MKNRTHLSSDDEWGDTISRVDAPLRELVRDKLRNAILDFSLKPGDRLVERVLVERMGVSRTTIREVMRDLTSEGLIVSTPKKGSVVAQLSASEAADLYEVRAGIEALIVKRFVEQASDEAIQRLRRDVEAFDDVVRAHGSIHEMLTAKDNFYATLIEGANSPTLDQILSSLQARVRVLRAQSLSVPGRPEIAVTELRALVKAIEVRDSKQAAALTGRHIAHAARSSGTRLDQERALSEALLSPAPSSQSRLREIPEATNSQLGLREQFARVRGEWRGEWQALLELDPGFLAAYLEAESVHVRYTSLTARLTALVVLAVNAIPGRVDEAGLRDSIKDACDAGASSAEVMEVLEVTTTVLSNHAGRNLIGAASEGRARVEEQGRVRAFLDGSFRSSSLEGRERALVLLALAVALPLSGTEVAIFAQAANDLGAGSNEVRDLVQTATLASVASLAARSQLVSEVFKDHRRVNIASSHNPE
jgi:DNA-binding GntR family transcriptional regulator